LLLQGSADSAQMGIQRLLAHHPIAAAAVGKFQQFLQRIALAQYHMLFHQALSHKTQSLQASAIGGDASLIKHIHRRRLWPRLPNRIDWTQTLSII
jgi:hypothetical protein